MLCISATIMASLHIDDKQVPNVGLAETSSSSSPQGTSNVFDERISHVPEKYRGTSADEHDMSVLGKKQVLRRNFNFITMLGFASTVFAASHYPERSLTLAVYI